MTGSKDEYYNKAKQEGYRARSAYKLKQIDDRWDVINSSDTVVDLGAAPGGWLQVAQEKGGKVLGVDLQTIEPIEGVETLVGDITEDETREKILDKVGETDVVVSDASPELSGNWNVDHARSVHLSRAAFETAEEILSSGGNFVVKVFQGDMLDEFKSEIEDRFNFVKPYSPDASRDESSEIYIVAKGYLTSPVKEGETVEVEIVDEGEEGDGIAKIEGYTIIVSDAEKGKTVEVEVTDVKPNYAFAEKS